MKVEIVSFDFQKNMFAFVMPEGSKYLHDINYTLVNSQHDRIAENFCRLYLINPSIINDPDWSFHLVS